MSGGAVRVGLLGCGTVGAEVVRLLDAHRDDLEHRAGCRLDVVRIAVRDPDRDRGLPVDRSVFTSDAAAVVSDPGVDIVCELVGGVEPARGWVLSALRAGRPVVTANKALLATAGREIFDAAEETGTDLYFEAAVGGGIPLIRPLKESLAGERLTRVMGIVNGTTNYVLTRMTTEGADLDAVLREAQRLGYAEADPSADVDGHDAAAKCAILASIAFNARVTVDDVHREGIGGIGADDVAVARRLGYVIKPLAIAELDGDRIAARVHPAMIPAAHPLAAVGGVTNAVYLEGPSIGELMFSGRGAGGAATATAVIGDLVSVARNLRAGGHGVGCTCFHGRSMRPIGENLGQFAIVLRVEDRPGVLADVARVLADRAVSIRTAWQEGLGEDARLVFVTHRAIESGFRDAERSLRGLPSVREVVSVLRVEAEE